MRSAVLIVLIVAEGFTLLEQTAVPFWGQTTQMLSTLCPKRNCSPKRVKRTFWAEPACCLELEMATLRSMPRDLSTVARITATFSHDSPCVRRTHGMQIRKRQKRPPINTHRHAWHRVFLNANKRAAYRSHLVSIILHIPGKTMCDPFHVSTGTNIYTWYIYFYRICMCVRVDCLAVLCLYRYS